MLSLSQLLLQHLFILTAANSDNLTVHTRSGGVRGVVLRTFLSNKEFIAYKGIPYAEPPIGNLRFKAPVPIAPWPKTLSATEYGDSCIEISPLQNKTRSENCLYLNIYTPVTASTKYCARKAVMFFIHGGSFTRGDGTDGFYGPDFLINEDVLVVTINYRLGPWGFSNFDIEGYTGNMGFKDQQLALEWVKRNIIYFGGDPNRITLLGQSAGAVATHLHMLSERSRKSITRAILMSGVTFGWYAKYPGNSHVEVYKKVLGLGAEATRFDVLEFMLNATDETIRQKTAVLDDPKRITFSTVFEDVTKAEEPFLTRSPREIYETSKIDVEAMFGFTSAEYIFFINPKDPFSWIEPMKNYSNIVLPFTGLTLSQESAVYRKAAKKIYDFYFGTRELKPTAENLNIFVQMNSDGLMVHPVYEALRYHSKKALTFCYKNGLDLNLNGIKILYGLQGLYGMAHMDDPLYLFFPKQYAQLYTMVLAKPDDPKNRKTLEALHFLPKMFANFAKTGNPGNFERYGKHKNCINITNDGLKQGYGSTPATVKFWDEIYEMVKPWIVNPF